MGDAGLPCKARPGVTAFLHLAARHGRWCLVLGLLGGLFLPQVAAAMQPALPVLVALLIFVAALRIGPGAALGSIAEARGDLGLLLIFQLALPIAGFAVFAGLGLSGSLVALALVLMMSAPSISGSANFTILLGHDPAPALRLAVLGTALFPLTVLPVFWLLPGLDGPAVLGAALRVLGAIALATGTAFALRRWAWPAPSAEALRALDGLSAILLGVVVIGLMAALGPALRQTPWLVLGWTAVVFAANFGLQAGAFMLLRNKPGAVPRSIIAGNRNVALYLIALPPELSAPLLIFIGCYQLPMFLTPILMAPLYRRAAA